MSTDGERVKGDDDVPDKSRVGLDAGTFSFDEVEGGVVGHIVSVYQVCDDHCR